LASSVQQDQYALFKKAPDVTDILPTMRRHGVIVPVLVRQNGSPETFEIVAGARRFHAASLLAEERRAAGRRSSHALRHLESGDDADAIEASLIENSARLDPDEVTRWEASPVWCAKGARGGLSTTFGLPDLAVSAFLRWAICCRASVTYRRKEKIDHHSPSDHGQQEPAARMAGAL
jgi:ParB family chromosome partitioning protein